jgi:hypothetical protein
MELEQWKKNQQEFRALLEKHGISQGQAAKILTNVAFHGKVTPRRVRTWLASPEAKSAVKCPLWAVENLRKAVSDMKKTEDNGTPNNIG